MNLCVLYGIVTEDVEFKFYINSKKISIARTKIKLNNNSIVTIKGYNNMADWMYRNIKENDKLYVTGKIDTNMEIVVEEIIGRILK